MTRKVKVGNVCIGGGSPVSVQTMLDKPSYDIEGNVKQACEVEESGCDILRIAVPDEKSLLTFEAVKRAVSIPLVADIHYDYRLAVKAVDCGADKIRINPGNIGGEEKVRIVTDKCKNNGTAIRIGVNAGSLASAYWNRCLPHQSWKVRLLHEGLRTSSHQSESLTSHLLRGGCCAGWSDPHSSSAAS